MTDKVMHVQFLEEVEVGWTNDRPDGCLIARSELAIKKFIREQSWFDTKLKEFSRPVGGICYFTVDDEAIKKLDSVETDAVWLSRSETNKFLKDRVHDYQPKTKIVTCHSGLEYEIDINTGNRVNKKK